MDISKQLVDYSMIIRYSITFLVFYILSNNIYNKYVNKYFYLIIPILLILLDEIDNIFTVFHKYNNNYTKTFYYQYNDKICDIISYFILFLFFKIDNIALFFILYRLIGVILFTITKDSIYLIIFFDFVKEYLLYLFIFGKNYNYILFFVIGKICFEYYYHTIHNKNNYKMQ